METVNDFRNELLKRREVKIIVEAESNPGFDKAGDIISGELKSEKDTVVVRGVKSKFGRNTFLIDAFVYDSKEDKEKIEPKVEAKKAEGESPAAPVAKTEAKPAEEKVEEKKEEAKEEKVEEAKE
tara:strand:- start:2792 stop:3166 length:375 start_codon:yes stop_codon:yes gene_type:complete